MSGMDEKMFTFGTANCEEVIAHTGRHPLMVAPANPLLLLNAEEQDRKCWFDGCPQGLCSLPWLAAARACVSLRAGDFLVSNQHWRCLACYQRHSPTIQMLF